MITHYSLSDAGVAKHRNRILLLLGCSVLAFILLLVLGLVRWSSAAYIGVNILLLGIGALSVIAYNLFGGRLDGKSGKEKKTFMILTAAVAGALWLFMTILKLNQFLSVFIFIADIILACFLFGKFKDIIKSSWNAVRPEEAKPDDGRVYYQIFLDNVHTEDSLISPMGCVYIGRHTVLFVLVDHTDGYILITPSGSLEIYEKKLFSDSYKSTPTIDADSFLHQSEWGAARVKTIIEEGCKKRNIPVPDMAYSNAVFLPSFDNSNYIYDENSYSNIPWHHKMGSYDKYKKKSAQKDYFQYFRGKACFRRRDINFILQSYDAQYREQHPDCIQNNDELDTIAQIIAEACDLVPTKPDPKMTQSFREEMAKKQMEYKEKEKQNK